MAMINSIKAILPHRWIRFFLFVLITIGFTYMLPSEFTALWAVILLVLYYRSSDEPFWLAFFLVTTDGFLGFFGMYTVMFRLLPGMPAIELVQFYFLFSFIKALKVRKRPFVFYRKYLVALLCYLIFMIIWGQINGFSGELNVYFRLVKLSLPMLLFFSIPRLFQDIGAYRRLFSFLFLLLLTAFATQVFTLLTGFSFAGSAQFTEEQAAEAGQFRGFFNVVVTLLSLFGALFFLAFKRKKAFNSIYLYIIVAFAFGIAYLSASRGWTLFFAMVIFLSFLLAFRFSPSRMAGLAVIFALFVGVALDNPIIKKQSAFTIERLESLEALAAGDITAGGTLQRLDQRSPRVMKRWADNPVFGWGFSDTYFKYADGHVGNQNILLFSGIIGFFILLGFMIFFLYKVTTRYRRLPRQVENRGVYPVLIFFLLGWIMLHSMGAQHFGYFGLPIQIIPQAVFFSFGALLYAKPSELSK